MNSQTSQTGTPNGNERMHSNENENEKKITMKAEKKIPLLIRSGFWAGEGSDVCREWYLIRGYKSVFKIVLEGKNYLINRDTNEVYDFDAYKESEEMGTVGTWGPVTEKITFN